MNAVLYLVKTGCQWRQLPNDFPPWKTVYSFFRRASLSGPIDKLLYEVIGLVREKADKSASPTYAIVDSQSVKGPSENRGYDGGKKIKGRKRHIAVDTRGIYRECGKGNLHDTQGGYYPALAAKTPYPTIMGFCGDAGYRGIFIEEIEEAFGLPVDIQERKKGSFVGDIAPEMGG